MKILVTGAAGFIGFHTARRLLALGHEVVGLDNLNEYYDVTLKEARLARLTATPGFRFERLDLADDQATVGKFIKGVTPQIAGIITFDTYPTELSQVRLQRVADVMKEFGLLKQPFDVSIMI